MLAESDRCSDEEFLERVFHWLRNPEESDETRRLKRDALATWLWGPDAYVMQRRVPEAADGSASATPKYKCQREVGLRCHREPGTGSSGALAVCQSEEGESKE
jgi:hypothetical protein